ncbi:hypothetical protein MPTK1_8g07190 [Marchantia polymorpha subsp. ruderalis]|uniref:Uncharacterized protein n=1 Tax=Marchantia polymorpha TaxID=3197 RepID=A0A2R6XIA6_MARPO|nr:hypothetical protein MARPO_0013s0073 [Marchantia polymorpha]BBN19001.1 hypothetical protein Mp_8g07190 [Marchantia polymorpha subsp. ruderalis]|eukprot:PTQ45845.1 hypothetical protein MARPO_0013s0073 [Marchantia polymorpha]
MRVVRHAASPRAHSSDGGREENRLVLTRSLIPQILRICSRLALRLRPLQCERAYVRVSKVATSCRPGSPPPYLRCLLRPTGEHLVRPQRGLLVVLLTAEKLRRRAQILVLSVLKVHNIFLS